MHVTKNKEEAIAFRDEILGKAFAAIEAVSRFADKNVSVQLSPDAMLGIAVIVTFAKTNLPIALLDTDTGRSEKVPLNMRELLDDFALMAIMGRCPDCGEELDDQMKHVDKRKTN